MEEYSNKWRFIFNPSKTFIVTFGESTQAFQKNKEMRTWCLYNKPIGEKQYCEHIGILLSGNFSGHKRTQEIGQYGKRNNCIINKCRCETRRSKSYMCGRNLEECGPTQNVYQNVCMLVICGGIYHRQSWMTWKELTS